MQTTLPPELLTMQLNPRPIALDQARRHIPHRPHQLVRPTRRNQHAPVRRRRRHRLADQRRGVRAARPHRVAVVQERCGVGIGGRLAPASFLGVGGGGGIPRGRGAEALLGRAGGGVVGGGGGAGR